MISKCISRFIPVLSFLLLLPVLIFSQNKIDNVPELNRETRNAVIDRLSQVLIDQYVSLDIARKCVELIKSKNTNGDYNEINSAKDFAKILREDLISISHDNHMRLDVYPPKEDDSAPSNPLMDSYLRQIESNQFFKRGNYGFMRAEWKSGNIGYVDLRAFPAVDMAREKAISVMKFLSDMDAIIIDLRSEVRGGAPEMVELICSYFFEKPTLLNTIYFRHTNKTLESWTLAKVDGTRMIDVPLYILTSKEVFSAGEAFAYCLQSLKRATVIGEVTKGGANLTRPVKLNDHLVFNIPYGKSINPITGTNWEGVGVVPDIIVKADEALDRALELAEAAAEKRRKAREENEILLAKDILKKIMDTVQKYDQGDKEKSIEFISNLLSDGLKSGIFTEEMINQTGYNFLNKATAELALEIFRFNAAHFPNSYNVFDSLGEGYMFIGNKQAAIENYNKSIENNPHNEGGISNLKKLYEMK